MLQRGDKREPPPPAPPLLPGLGAPRGWGCASSPRPRCPAALLAPSPAARDGEMGWGWGDTGLGFGVGAASPVGSPVSLSRARSSRSWMLPARLSPVLRCPTPRFSTRHLFTCAAARLPPAVAAPGSCFLPASSSKQARIQLSAPQDGEKTTRRHVAGARRACSTATWPGTPALPTAEGFWGGSVAPRSPHALLHPTSPAVLAPRTPSRWLLLSPTTSPRKLGKGWFIGIYELFLPQGSLPGLGRAGSRARAPRAAAGSFSPRCWPCCPRSTSPATGQRSGAGAASLGPAWRRAASPDAASRCRGQEHRRVPCTVPIGRSTAALSLSPSRCHIGPRSWALHVGAAGSSP